MADRKNLLLLFDRLQEPVFMQKGSQNSVFDLPDSFFNDRYRPIGNELQTRFGEDAETRIPVQNISIPDMRIPMSLGRHKQFSLWIPRHARIAGRLIDIFLGMRTIDELQSVAVYARDRCNPFVFNYALSVALCHRPDTKNLNIPLVTETFPDKFVDSTTLGKLREEATVVTTSESRIPIAVPKDYTASSLEYEHRLWYFREDIGINAQYWHWHLAYPFEVSNRAIVAKDRRGELFFYMHQQIIAVYNYERFSNRLARVKSLKNLREPIVEAYFPKMDSLVANRSYPARVTNTVLSDLDRESDDIRIDVFDLELWRDRFYKAIHQRFVVDESGNRIILDEVRGIDILGDMMEASILSPNRQLYGNLNSMGHVFLSYAHDPDERYLESFSVIGDSVTAMRDPVFYRWHAYVDDIFQEHKEMLTPYTTAQLNYPGVTVAGVSVQPESGAANSFQTFWEQSDVNLTRGLDFIPRGNVFARFTHLQHVPFTYVLQVNNAGTTQRFGMVRIFMGPRFDERGKQMLLRDQRHLMIEMDKFVVSLRPGQSTVHRRSAESTITIPYERTFRDQDTDRPAEGAAGELEFNFCGCGWPQHMLVPKGVPEGLRSELLFMVSDYELDKIEQDLVGVCNDTASFCGIRDRLYPDKRPMGYPFDRLPRQGSDRLANFLTPNMALADCTIVHTDKTSVRAQ